jgi:hypothetical protein
MRKLILLIVLAALCQGTFLFAQQNTTTSKYEESEYYYFNFPIEKIYIHQLGYMVVYHRNANKVARTFLPIEWFHTVTDGKGEIIHLRPGAEYPSMIVYYKNGEFSHVRLRLRQNIMHESWGGLIPNYSNIDDYFKNIEEVKLEF